MKTYEQVLETVEFALAKGEYRYCIEFLLPKIESFPLSSKEGVNLRTILITALCGVNKKEEAKRFCKELLKSFDNKTRENAKYLMEVIDSPDIKKPENWNVQFESNPSLNKKSLNSLRQKREVLKKKKFNNITETPTGETKPFQKGFSLIIFLILLLLIPLLSGCVKIEDTLDLSELDSITNNFVIESKYIKKFPWQLKFEEKMKDIFPAAEIVQDESTFSLKHKNLNLEDTKQVLKITQNTAGELAGESTKIEFERINGEIISASINPLSLGNPSIHSGQVIGLRLISRISEVQKNNTCVILGCESVECMRLEAGGMANMVLIEQVVPNSFSSSEYDVSKLLGSSRGNTSPLLENSIKIALQIFNGFKN